MKLPNGYLKGMSVRGLFAMVLVAGTATTLHAGVIPWLWNSVFGQSCSSCAPCSTMGIQPVYSAPAYSAPAYSAPAYSAPAYSYSAPVYSAPRYVAPRYVAPQYIPTATPAYTSYTTPVVSTPVAPMVSPACSSCTTTPSYSAPVSQSIVQYPVATEPSWSSSIISDPMPVMSSPVSQSIISPSCSSCGVASCSSCQPAYDSSYVSSGSIISDTPISTFAAPACSSCGTTYSNFTPVSSTATCTSGCSVTPACSSCTTSLPTCSSCGTISTVPATSVVPTEPVQTYEKEIAPKIDNGIQEKSQSDDLDLDSDEFKKPRRGPGDDNGFGEDDFGSDADMGDDNGDSMFGEGSAYKPPTESATPGAGTAEAPGKPEAEKTPGDSTEPAAPSETDSELDDFGFGEDDFGKSPSRRNPPAESDDDGFDLDGVIIPKATPMNLVRRLSLPGMTIRSLVKIPTTPTQVRWISAPRFGVAVR